ncbi:tRNA N(3)-methylcytidine methyltransferase METTL6 [Quercus lobata]|uniref:tRNA N(3)-methylcytidine methyltransferase n=1 Tax=Quercus lobata TaxID=97700 RepID=A0A7N2L7M2_QUELO|nr:tRNA N(3)-methylcytidine methyltransferase METTL6 [Quercus lobata]XP_030960822.1 tRNA N(3)-methylcytidine methyltransferase METTL6 [Quercus lobata]
MEAAEAEYFSKDFEWDELRAEVENDPSFRYHLLPFESSTIPSSQTTTRATTAEEEEDSTAWKRFHIRHSSGKFFKERRYLLKEFPELVSCGESSKVLEVGCGNGSTALPILRGNEHIIVYACDCSSEILERAEEIIDAATVVPVRHRFRTFCCDFSVTGLPKWLACHTCREVFLQKQQNCLSDVKESHERHYNDSNSLKESTSCIGGMDFVTLIFTLSAVTFQRMPASIKECFSVLKPGGMLLFRDYGLYDMTMLRFEPNQRVGFMEYMRSDGTRSYFFSLDTVRDLFVGAGFIELELEYCCVKSVNRRNEKTMQRVWVHGKFQKPM